MSAVICGYRTWLTVFVLCSDCAETQPIAAAQDDAVARRLWDISVQLVHLEDAEIHPILRQSS